LVCLLIGGLVAGSFRFLKALGATAIEDVLESSASLAELGLRRLGSYRCIE
jgi:hypothetical protein